MAVTRRTLMKLLLWVPLLATVKGSIQIEPTTRTTATSLPTCKIGLAYPKPWPGCSGLTVS